MSENANNVEASVWSELCDESILQQLDEPFNLEDESSFLRKEENYYGFDNNTGKTWIYPTNLPIRSYQFNITKAALFKNTLVVLPTGLGKTFIAAVVMYNIYRWYPMGKVIFMAPSRPLVAQQIEACRKIMGIPISDTAEMTGKQNKKIRRELWQTKRVFFATPQVVQSDINDVEQQFPFALIKLIVIDEAHRAKGRYAYTELVKTLVSRNPHFRVLALSATPGRRIEDVSEVVRNLLISHLEIRWENSIDVNPYTHRKNVKTVAVPLGDKLNSIRDEFVEIIDPYFRYLIENNVITGNVNNMSRGWLIMEQKRFREMSMHQTHPNQSNINQNFSICTSLFHALELLERHGIRAFLSSFDDNSNQNDSISKGEKFFVALNSRLKSFLQKLKNQFGPNPFFVCDLLTKSNQFENIPRDFDFGHPKFEIVKKFLLEHFEKDKESRVIVFSEFRESVLLLYGLLVQYSPIIRPRIFVGQGGTGYIRAVTQKEQIEVMKDFRSGVCNTLISTCVAEEGIDVGEVELIICFDISTKNPTRFTQRIGRTGRRKQGSVIMLATEGKELSIVKEVMATKDTTNKKIAKSKEVLRTLYKNSPRLVPPEFNPKSLETLMLISEEETVHQVQKRTTANRKEKPTKDKVVKKVTSGADVRKFFKKVDLDEEEREIFCTVKEIHALPENSPQRESEMVIAAGNSTEIVQSTSKDSIIKTHQLRELFKKVNIYSSRLDDPSSTKAFTLNGILHSNKLNDDVRKMILEKNLDFVRQKYEAMKALEALSESEDENEDIKNVKAEFSAIEDIFGSRYAIETVLNENKEQESYKTAYKKIEKKFSGLFADLDKRNFTDDVDQFIKTKLEEYDILEIDDYGYCVSSKEYLSNTVSYNEEDMTNRVESIGLDDRNGNLDDDVVFFDNIEFLENDSKYISQWTQNKIKNQSTPLRKNDIKHTSMHNKSPLMAAFAKCLPKSTANSPKVSPKILEENIEFEISKDFFDSDFETIEKFSEVKTNEEKAIASTSILSENINEISDKLFEDDDFDEMILINSVEKKIEDHNTQMINDTTKTMKSSNYANTTTNGLVKPLNPEISNTLKVPEKFNNASDFKEDYFDAEFDEIIACSSNILTQIEKRVQSSAQEESMISVEQILDIVSEREKCQKANETNITNPELENFDLNDFLEPFNFEEEEDDADVVHPSQPQPLCKMSKNFPVEFKDTANISRQVTSNKNRSSNVTTQLVLISNSNMKEDKSLHKHSNTSSNTSPSLLRRGTNSGRLRLFCSGRESSKSCINITESSKFPQERNENKNIINLKHFYDKSNKETTKTNGFSQNAFEETFIGRGFLKRRARQAIESSESEGENNIDSVQKRLPLSKQRKIHRKAKRRRCEFFDDEAKESGNECTDEEGENTYDDGLSQFIVDSVVADEEDAEHPYVNIKAKYLESVRSPNNIGRGFKIPTNLQFVDMSKICSQPVVEESLSAYKEDSFVVTDEDEVFDGESSVICPLEKAEAILEARRKARKNGRNCDVIEENTCKQKRWRNLKCFSESSDDEIS